MTITEFLEARIAEDEVFATAPRRTFGHEVHLSDPIGAYRPNCPDCVGVHGGARMAAECAAKRKIIGKAERAGVAFGQSINPASAAASFALTEVLHYLAAVYADHPDYLPEWAP